jgi:hypothetical protein
MHIFSLSPARALSFSLHKYIYTHTHAEGAGGGDAGIQECCHGAQREVEGKKFVIVSQFIVEEK